MGWSWVIGLGFVALGAVITGWLALAIGLGAVDASHCARAVFVAAGGGLIGLLIFGVAVLIALLR